MHYLHVIMLFVFFINAMDIRPITIENRMLDELDNDSFIASDDYSLNDLPQQLKEKDEKMEMTVKEYVNIDNNIQLWKELIDETVIQEVLIDEGIQGEIIPSSNNDTVRSCNCKYISFLNNLMKKAERTH
jgi:hypothetical protein